MTNEGLQAMFDEFGERICFIQFDNNIRFMVGYPSSPIKTINDIQLRTFNGVDMVGFPVYSINPQMRRMGANSVSWFLTGYLESIAVIDEGFEDLRIDALQQG